MSRLLRNISYHVDKNVGIITLNNGPNNTLTNDFVSSFHKALELVEESPPVVLLIHSNAKHFCAGADLKERKGMDNVQVKLFTDGLRKMTRRVFELACPTICSVKGSALGGGLEIALSCNLRVFQNDSKVGLPEVGLAIIPGALGTQYLTRLNYGLANELILTSKIISGDEAFQKGLCQYVSDDSFAFAQDLAKRIATKGPIALRAAKMAIQSGYGQLIDEQVQVEEACYAQTIPTKDRIEGLDSFLEKRKPMYKGE
eukprot:NODE_550_length_6834_cov_0.214402.p3 type:complete len:257 gc:universal NODE_550_length_6834_cov_0.214402:4697-5467(+)